jgi:acetyltransferase-like isoleucine patch superfamily enzyme
MIIKKYFKKIYLFFNNKQESEKVYLFKNVMTYDSQFGDYTYVSYNSIIHCAIIGKFCSIGPNVVIGYGDHPIHFLSTSPIFYQAKKGMFGENLYSENDFEHHKKVIIGNDVWIGSNVYVKNGVTIGDGAVIGAGAVVTKDIPPYAIVVGVPAKILKYRFDNETISELLKNKWWDWKIEDIKKHKSTFVNKPFH